jgi:hypothetical protein
MAESHAPDPRLNLLGVYVVFVLWYGRTSNVIARPEIYALKGLSGKGLAVSRETPPSCIMEREDVVSGWKSEKATGRKGNSL